MTIPVIRQLLEQHPGLSVTVVSDKKFTPLFNEISRLEYFPADIDGRHKGLTGLYRLYRDLKNGKKLTAIADLHNVLRTKILNFYFSHSGCKIVQIEKGRTEKKALTRKHNKILKQLPSTFQRYADVFSKLGFPVRLSPSPIRIKLPATSEIKELAGKENNILIGLAPFAKHKEKMYPLEKMEEVIEAILKKGYKLFLFGGGAFEINQLRNWEKKFPAIVHTAGKYSFEQELILISQLHIMISMDSANMHLASLFGVPVISVWGATHPFAGFYGYAQDISHVIQTDLYCRPCSVFGNKKCYRGDRACMQMIFPHQIVDKLEEVLQSIKI